MKYLSIITIIIFTSCITFETEIQIESNAPIVSSEIENGNGSEIVEVEFDISTNQIWSTLEPIFQNVSESKYFKQLATDGSNLYIEIKNCEFVRTHSLFIDNCDASWFSVYYYDLKKIEFFLGGNCYESTIGNTNSIIFTIEIKS